MSAELEERIRALVEAAVADAASTITDQVVEQLVALVPDLVRERLLGVLDGAIGGRDVKPPKSKRDRKATIAKRAKETKSKPAKNLGASTTKGTPRQRAVMKCGKCGREGSRADGCGKTHEPLKSSDDAEGE